MINLDFQLMMILFYYYHYLLYKIDIYIKREKLSAARIIGSLRRNVNSTAVIPQNAGFN